MSIPPGSGVPVPGAIPGSMTSMSRAEVDGVRAVERLVDGVVDHGLGAPLLDLAHQVPAQALLLHPGERLGRRPVAAQPDLDEVLPLTAPDSMSRRMGVPWPASTPQSSFAVSAWASKWTMPMLPGRRTSATAVAAAR